MIPEFRAAFFGTSLLQRVAGPLISPQVAGPGERCSVAEGVREQLSFRWQLRDDPDRLEQRRERIRRRLPTTAKRWCTGAICWFELRAELGGKAAERAAYHVKCTGLGSCRWCEFCGLSQRCGMPARVVGAPSWGC